MFLVFSYWGRLNIITIDNKGGIWRTICKAFEIIFIFPGIKVEVSVLMNEFTKWEHFSKFLQFI